jgi:very-short-patch-repair endonuclease
MSKGEELFMHQLMENQLDIPKAEYKFLKNRRFRFDFAWPDRMMAVEVEGGVFSGGRHTRGMGYTRDLEKYNLATLHGWRVFRFTTQDVTTQKAIAFISAVMDNNRRELQQSYEDISRRFMLSDTL